MKVLSIFPQKPNNIIFGKNIWKSPYINTQVHKLQNDSFEYSNKNIFKTVEHTDVFDKTLLRTTYIAQNGETYKIVLEKNKKDALIEFEKNNKGQYSKTIFKATRKPNSRAYCQHRQGKGSKSKKMYMSWTYPNMDFNYQGSSDNLQIFKDALLDLKSIIFSDELIDDFGKIRSLNIQLRDSINYLQKQININSSNSKN